MSERGEIPANKEEPSRNGDDDEKHDEVLASAVIDDNDDDDEDGSEGSNDNDAVAAVVEDDPAAATVAAAAAAEGTPASEAAAPVKKEEEEDGEVMEENPDDIKKTSDEDKKTATSTVATDSNEKKKDEGVNEKDSPSAVNKPAEQDVKMDEPTTSVKEEEEGEVMEPTAKEPSKENNIEKVASTHSDSIMAATTEDNNKPKEAPSEPTKKEGDDNDEEEGEVKEDETEEGEIEDSAAPEKEVTTTKTGDITFDKPAEVKKAESGEDNKKMEIDSTEKEDQEKDKPPAEKEEAAVEESLKDKEDTVDDVKDKEEKPADEEKDSTPDPEKTDTTPDTEAKEKADKNDDDEAMEEDKPTPMDVEKEKPKFKVSESSSQIKKHDEDDDEDGEIHDDAEEEGGHQKEAEEESDTKDDTEEEGEINEDADMDDALSQSEEGGDRDRDAEMASADADTASVDDTSVADDADEKTKKVEPSYSTRRSASGTTTPVPRDTTKAAKSSSLSAAAGNSASGSAHNEQWQRSVREALEGLGRGGSKEGTPAGVGPGGASFLEALGEEERRTRTRFLPAVDGIHMLRKNEIKGDLALARSIMSSAGSVANVASVAAGANAGSSVSKKSKKKKQDSGEGDAMDTEDGEVMSSSEEDPMDGGRVGNASTIEVDKGDLLVVPSSVFVPPPDATHSSAPTSSNGEKEDGAPPPPAINTGVKGILNNQRNIKSPRVVESVTAFNPPRPPESVGRKKQHRMLRWERRPADVELDLNSYRKTVDRTRKELHTEEAELERIEATSNHLRRHFLGHLRCMDQEMENIMGELNSVQQKCVNAADLLTSRTRSRGAGKGSYVMKDVLTVLKARGEQLDEKGLSIRDDFLSHNDIPQNFPGLGGVGGSSFADWNHLSTFPESTIASAWVLPGDKVQTPYGDGVVTDISESNISVRLPFGVGHFNPAAVTSKEYANTLTDAALAKRWRGIIDTAVAHSGLLDLNGMESVESTKPKTTTEDKSQHDESVEGNKSTANGGAAVDGSTLDKDMDDPEHQKENSSCDETKLLPFGSSLLPTGTGRGDKLCEMNALQLQNEFKTVLTDGTGVLGDPANEGVTSEVKDFEESTQESYILQARVFHLRNQLYRQRRIRTLNERTFAATRDKSIRVESLVSEMRTDLKSLKYRLDEELKELGIDQDRADAILKSYYLAQDYDEHELEEDDHHSSPTSKRPRDDDAKHSSSVGHVSETEKSSGNGVADADMERHTKRLKVASH